MNLQENTFIVNFANNHTDLNKKQDLKVNINIDGPYASCSRLVFDSEQVILICAGIGVTPFASILKTIWFNYASKCLKTCANCKNEWFEECHMKKLKKVDFIWINRDYSSVEWFLKLLCELEIQQLNLSKDFPRLLNMHLYCTKLSKDSKEYKIQLDNLNLNSLELKMKNEEVLKHSLEAFNLSLKPGRPDFDKIFQNIDQNRISEKVNAFFCGPIELAKSIQKQAVRYKFNFEKENF